MSLPDLKNDALSFFENAFGHAPSKLTITPGRVNLIGEHTDYNNGFVFPCAIDLYTIAASSPRDDNEIHVISEISPESEIVFRLNNPVYKAVHAHKWSNYVRGVADVLLKEGLDLKGVNLTITGNLPTGGGLSSSAALEVSIANTLLVHSKIELPKSKVAKLCQRSENEYIGLNCGIMDQTAVIFGKKNNALLLDCQSLEMKQTSIPDHLTIVIINSNIKHALVDNEYNKRAEQCQKACDILNIKSLRELDAEHLEVLKMQSDEVVYLRAKHVFNENKRAELFFLALKNNSLNDISRLMHESHMSLKNNYEVTIAETDALVNMISDVIGDQGGVRMTGGGFGGCVVAVTPQKNVKRIQEAVETQYKKKFNNEATIYVCNASDGASVI